MEELLLYALGAFILTRFRKKEAETTATPSNSSSSVPDFVTGRVKIYPWPTSTPKTIQEVEFLFYVGPGGRSVGPAANCVLPNKPQLKSVMIGSIQRLAVLASMWNQMSQPQRDSDQGDRIRDEVDEVKNNLDAAYRALKQGCLNPPTQAAPPSASTSNQRMSP